MADLLHAIDRLRAATWHAEEAGYGHMVREALDAALQHAELARATIRGEV